MSKKYRAIQDINTEAFFSLIRAGLFGCTDDADTLLQDGVDWMEVYQLAKEQCVVGILAEGVEIMQKEWMKTHDSPLMPKNLVLKLAGATLKLEEKNVAMNKFIAQLFDRLQRKVDINSLLLKGQGVALCYEKPLRRNCGDVDLLLNEEDYQKAKDVLRPIATKFGKEHKYKKHVALVIAKWTVELHGSLRFGFSSRIDKELDRICHTAFIGGQIREWTNMDVQIPMLGKENDVLYVFTHFLNHFYKGGVGIRQISDWSRMLWTFRDSLDLGYLESRVKAMGLMSEWRAFGMYAVEYLGMPECAMPLYVNSGKWKRKARRIQLFILKTGNMGFNRKDKNKTVSFLTRKTMSSWQRFWDLTYHMKIFPMDTLRFFPSILLNGMRQK